MKVLLVNPNRYHYAGAKGPRATLPLGLMYIASWLEKNSIKVRIFDTLTSPYTVIRTVDSTTIHGVSDDDFRRVISDEDPDIVGIGFPFTAQLEGSLNAAKLVKEVNPAIVVVAGGPHVSVAGQDLLRDHSEITYGVRGEGEMAMLSLVNAIAAGLSPGNIPGLIFRSGTEIRTNPPELIKKLDSLPYPAYHLLDMERFFHSAKKIGGRAVKGHTRSISMITSRGCPFNCIFCSIHLHMGKQFRYHSSRYVFAHIEYVTRKLGVTHIAFEDDNLTFRPERCTEIFSSVIKNNISFNWNTPNGVRADFLNEELLGLMKKAGCVSLTVAAESGSQKTLNTIINKKLDLTKIVDVARLCRKLEIPLNCYFVIGLPGETKAAMHETVDFAIMLWDKYGVSPSIFSATPLVGTRLYDVVMSNGYLAKDITPRNLMSATQAVNGEPMLRTPEFTPEDVKEIAGHWDLHRANVQKSKMTANKDAKTTSVLHIVPYSFPQPEHKFLGSTKDIFCRTEYFKKRGIQFDMLAPGARDDKSLLPELARMDLSKYQAVLIEKADYPLSMLHIRETAPHMKIMLRGHNAEFYHHMHRVIARVKDNWHDGMHANFKENIWDIETSLKWGGRDYVCAQLADAVLSIAEWERLNYWNLIADPNKVFTVPSFLAEEYISAAQSGHKRSLCVCYMSGGVNPMLADSARQFNSLVESLPDNEGWEFGITGDPEKIGTDLSGRITKLGLLEEPFSILKEARCIVILSDFGFGFKTKILDAAVHKCWTIVTAGLYNYLPEIIRPFCIRLEECSAGGFNDALGKSMKEFPEGDPNAQFRDIAFNALDHIFGYKDMGDVFSKNAGIQGNGKSEIPDRLFKTLKVLSREFELLQKCRLDAGKKVKPDSGGSLHHTLSMQSAVPEEINPTTASMKMIYTESLRKRFRKFKKNFKKKLHSFRKLW